MKGFFYTLYLTYTDLSEVSLCVDSLNEEKERMKMQNYKKYQRGYFLPPVPVSYTHLDVYKRQ